MKIKKYLILVLPVFLFGGGLLNELKQKELDYDSRYSVQDSKDTEKSWINPVMLQYSYSKDNSTGTVTTSNTFSISVNQPVFKSGAIYYSIKYAENVKNYNLGNIELQRRELIKQALDTAYDYKIDKIKEKIILLNIKNAEIDVMKKKEDFLNGVGDSTLLNNAVLTLNSLKLSLEDIQTGLDSLKYSFADLSSLNLDTIKLPEFKIVPVKKYLNGNLDLIQQKRLKKVKKDLYKMQVGNQLLSVSFNASLNWQKNDYETDTPFLQDGSNNYYRVGLSIDVPISFNAVNKIEKTKLDYLKSQILIQDKKQALVNKYNSIIRQIKSVDKKISIYKNNIKIYDNLINSTLDSIQAGNATNLDLEILENSKKTMYLNIRILKLQKQKLLLNLYYKLVGFKI